ncbi:MAG: DUF2997 domain-containing protein [Clostridiales bacterium]|nr:DUF2997 domain-containing protein [Clostridiales bacterium]
MRKQLQVRIYPDGKIDAQTLGIKGEKCTDYIAVFEQLLQARTIESSYTNEYYQTEVQETDETVMQKTKE